MRRFVVGFALLTFLTLIFSTDLRVLFNQSKYLSEAKVGRAKADLLRLSKAADTYKNKQGKYPETLKDLVGGGYIDHEAGNELTDPWGNDYHYDPKGTRNGGSNPDIWTYTPDGKDIGNWAKENE